MRKGENNNSSRQWCSAKTECAAIGSNSRKRERSLQDQGCIQDPVLRIQALVSNSRPGGVEGPASYSQDPPIHLAA